jgi:plasmid stability protein
MAAFHLRDIPEETYARLRARAAANGRSINAELLRLLEEELGAPPSESFDERLDRLLAEYTAGPDAPDVVAGLREDRDSR